MRVVQSKEGYMGSAKKKRSHAPTVRDKNILNLYNKLHEIVSLLAELLHIQLMTDTTVLHLSTLGKLLINFFHKEIFRLRIKVLVMCYVVFVLFI